MHDELNCSVKSDKEGEDVKDIMENMCESWKFHPRWNIKSKIIGGDAK
jgi:hypothetical protein